MRERKKFPFTAYRLTRTCRVVPVQIAGPSTYWRGGAMDEKGKHFEWVDLHANVADAITAGKEMIAAARKKIEQMEALQDERGINLDKAAQRAQAQKGGE